MRHFISTLLLVVISLISLSAYADEPTTYNQIVLFGDSLSDNGNLYNTSLHIIPKSPPYHEGRFTNGPTWSDLADTYFSTHHNIKIENYAVGGETTVFHNPFGGFLPYTFTMSLNNYLFHTLFNDKSHTLFIIWIGANDYLNGSTNPDIETTQVVQTIQQNIETLISKGAKNFLVLNLPDLSLTPLGIASTNAAVLHTLTTLHNTKLQAVLTAMQTLHNDVNVHYINVDDIFTDLSAHPEIYNQKYNTHISNISTSCWPGSYTYKNIPDEEQSIQKYITIEYQKNSGAKLKTTDMDFKAMAHYIASSPSLKTAYDVSRGFADGQEACATPEQYIFWDRVHPTAATHFIIGSIMIDKIKEFYRIE
jgi:phospholipase/lecithinase/hemolysin